MSRDKFASALDQGVAEGILPDEADRHGAETRTVRTWLFLLGYIRRNTESAQADRELCDGLRALRRDSGMNTVENGLDAEILPLLRRLLCFDPDAAMQGTNLSIRRRFSGIALDSPLMSRAICLRLYALDFLDRLPGEKPDRKKMLAGLREFSRIYSLLGLGNVSPAVDRQTITALFDPYPVLRKLQDNDQATAIWHPEGSSTSAKRRNRELVKKYVNAVARIELWLIGYLSRPRKHMWSRDQANRSLPSALRAFWRDQPEQVRPPARKLEYLDGSFFQRLQAVIEFPAGGHDSDQEALQAELLGNPELAKAVRRETMSLGARLLDGAKRTARFVIGWIRMRLRQLVALARTMASLISSSVRNTFGVVRDTVFALGVSWRFLTRNPLPGSSPEHLLLFHDKDFDFVLLQNPNANPLQVRKISDSVAFMARLLAATGRFVGQLIDAFLLYARRSGFGGWFGALITLLGADRRIDEMRETAYLIRATRNQLDALQP